jgi:hypothetical protein
VIFCSFIRALLQITADRMSRRPPAAQCIAGKIMPPTKLLEDA